VFYEASPTFPQLRLEHQLFFFFFETPTCLKAFSPLSSALAYKKIQFFFTLTLSDFFLSSRIMSSVKALQTQQPKVVKNLANQQKAISKTSLLFIPIDDHYSLLNELIWL
jgi:hypothetical protein